MCVIFLLAGAFAEIGKATGAVDAVVGLGLGLVPPVFLLPGVFLVAAFISLSIGTSMGTLAAVAPIALGIGDAAGLDRVLVLGAVIGGAMFGDNLSVISDTTIAATRTQGAEMRDKFRENLKFAAPAAVLTVVLLAFLGDAAPAAVGQSPSAWLILPYLVVLVLALAGLDVIVVLGIGIVLAGAFGAVAIDGYGPLRFAGDVWRGYEGMVEITLLSLLIGGLGALIRAAGGLAWLARLIAIVTGGRRSPRAGEAGIAALAVGTDALTANNTVAILVVGDLARDLAQRNGVTPRRAASVLDIFACVTQGVLPWGAQILLAGALGGVSPRALAGSVHYCWALAAATLVGMAWRRPTVRPATAAAAEGA
jgi:Na+/H+ antiporter NhaC